MQTFISYTALRVVLRKKKKKKEVSRSYAAEIHHHSHLSHIFSFSLPNTHTILQTLVNLKSNA